MDYQFKFKEWIISFINVFGFIFLFMTIAYVCLIQFFNIEISLGLITAYSLAYGLFSAKGYMYVTLEIDGVTKNDLEKVLNKIRWKINYKKECKYILNIPLIDRFMSEIMEVNIKENKIKINGARKYVELLKNQLKINKQFLTE